MQESNKTVYIAFGWIFFAISLVFLPVLFAAGTFIMGYLTRRAGDQVHGTILMVFSVVGAFLGFMLGLIVALSGY